MNEIHSRYQTNIEKGFYLERNMIRRSHIATIVEGIIIYLSLNALIFRLIPSLEFHMPSLTFKSLLSDLKEILVIFFCIPLTFNIMKIKKAWVRRSRYFKMKYYTDIE